MRRSALATGLLALVASACTGARVTAPIDEAPLGTIEVVEVAADGVPDDWIVVRNASAAPVDLGDYLFVDRRDDLERARHFPPIVLAPGERHRQRISHARNGFALGEDEEVWVYRADGRLSHGVDWDRGDARIVAGR